MFLNNKYTRYYNNIINNAKTKQRDKKDSYFEEHHIIPRCLDGLDDESNLVLLTAREHFICHWLLTKMNSNRKLLFAFSQFQRKIGYRKHILTARQYEVAKLYAVKALSTPRSDEFKKKLSLARIGMKFTNTHKQNISRAKMGTKVSELRRNQMSKISKSLGLKPPTGFGENNSFYGKEHTEETKKILSEKAKERWKKNKAKYLKSHANRDLSYITDEYRQLKSEQSKKLWEAGIISRDLSGSNNPMYGKQQSESTRQKISAANKGKLAGSNNPMYGKPRSKKVKEALSEYRMGSCWMHNDELRLCKQVNKNQIFEYQIDGWTRGRRRYT